MHEEKQTEKTIACIVLSVAEEAEKISKGLSEKLGAIGRIMF